MGAKVIIAPHRPDVMRGLREEEEDAPPISRDHGWQSFVLDLSRRRLKDTGPTVGNINRLLKPGFGIQTKVQINFTATGKRPTLPPSQVTAGRRLIYNLARRECEREVTNVCWFKTHEATISRENSRP